MLHYMFYDSIDIGVQTYSTHILVHVLCMMSVFYCCINSLIFQTVKSDVFVVKTNVTHYAAVT